MTQHQKIIKLFCMKPEGTILFAKDFQQPGLGELFVGYEATARLSEVDLDNPGLFERVKQDRFIGRRLRWEAYAEWFPRLPKDLQEVVKQYKPVPLSAYRQSNLLEML